MEKNGRDSLLKGVEELDKNLKYVKNRKKEDNLNQRTQNGFPKQETKDQLEDVVVFDLETLNYQEFAEVYATGLYDANRLRDGWGRDLTPDERLTEKTILIVFNGTNGNPVMNMPKYISENYESDERIYIDKDGDKIVSSYRFLLVVHNSSGIDS